MRFVGVDPSTGTGFVALDETGAVLVAKELSGVGSIDPLRISTLVDEVRGHLRRDDVVCIEGFSYGSKGRGVSFQYGLGWALRIMMHKGLKRHYIEVSPSTVKKFSGAKGNSAKEAVQAATLETFGVNFENNNINDAYVLARIALEKHSKEVLAK
jgi:crossover junction endodeoxyribonuclease RuvC